jgi:hypothetical protein
LPKDSSQAFRIGEPQYTAVTSSARQYIRFLSYFAEVGKLAELRDAGVITVDDFDKKKSEIPDWRLHTAP